MQVVALFVFVHSRFVKQNAQNKIYADNQCLILPFPTISVHLSTKKANHQNTHAMNTIPDTYKYSSVDMAKYIIAEAKSQRLMMNVTKLQKLLYIVYGVYLSLCNERLVNELPQAWPYGPVFPTTRRRFSDYDFTGSETSVPAEMKENDNLTQILNFVLSNFGSWTASQLVAWTHKDDSPWTRIKNNKENFDWGTIIPDEYTKEFFDKMFAV